MTEVWRCAVLGQPVGHSLSPLIHTRAYEVLKGIGLLFLCNVVSSILSLNTVNWFLESFLTSGSIILVLLILFQPEIRRVLE